MRYLKRIMAVADVAIATPSDYKPLPLISV